jgi:hypothetical protein
MAICMQKLCCGLSETFDIVQHIVKLKEMAHRMVGYLVFATCESHLNFSNMCLICMLR